MIEIDGSGGGGQILRTSLALSALEKKSVRVFNIRAKRPKPGLKTQHMKSIHALQWVCSAEVEGCEPGSKEIRFYPGDLRQGKLKIDIGTAGSVTLILQALMITSVRRRVKAEIAGGTMVKWSPTFHYMNNVTLPVLQKTGFKGEMVLKRHGFYPKGGGKVVADFGPSKLKPIYLTKRGETKFVFGFSTATKDLERAKVAERMKKSAKKIIPDSNIDRGYVDADSTGAAMDLIACTENSIFGSNSLGEPGRPAEKVGKEAAKKLLGELDSGAALDEHMSDQILPFLALAGGGRITVPRISRHVKTNMEVIERFLPVRFWMDGKKIFVEKI